MEIIKRAAEITSLNIKIPGKENKLHLPVPPQDTSGIR